MKTFFIINIFLLFVFPSFSQTSNNTKKDTTEFCIPYSVAQKILLDLNEINFFFSFLKLLIIFIYNFINLIYLFKII